MKKILIGILSLTVVYSSFNNIKADEFNDSNESHYITLCSSSTLSKSNQKVCTKFNEYLKKKADNIKNNITKQQSDLNNTNQNITTLQNEIESINNEVNSLQTQIDYYQKSIEEDQKKIDEKNLLLKQRIYSSQSLYNSNAYTSFLFNASSLNDLFSNISNISQLTSYEKELAEEIKKLQTQKKEKKDELTRTSNILKEKQKVAKDKQNSLISLKVKQASQLEQSQNAQNQISNSQRKIDAALEALIAKDKASTVSYSGGVGQGSDVGKNIANAALTQLGKRYYWGATGPTYYDCSGLVYWAYNQAGVKIGRTTAAGYSRSGKAVSRSELSAGDVITFSYGSGVAHIGIYLGNGKFVHASGTGSTTVGQYADQCVKVATLAGRWQGYVYNYRRLY